MSENGCLSGYIDNDCIAVNRSNKLDIFKGHLITIIARGVISIPVAAIAFSANIEQTKKKEKHITIKISSF